MPVAEAAFVMVSPLGVSAARKASIEAAMFEALQKAQNEGLTDPAEIRARILAARDAVAGD